ncbi:YoaK family protein [Comamonas aquatica]|uniref:Predicted membrane protein n=1 Tax=Comamonas aquatica TaxID=225991 RepID=A0AA35D5K7_9BURK|nr:YoaK family protein [Comamonas aquatica]CAB5666490.1 Predicted membrane protein [Comamonas aquatica]CAB5671526.1 Predicted membrane protein [Comamonas aquatica]CAC9226236.1 Predicted membrane protein [Comamonas aquatica]CAC9682879.1 Predicted membrane protein [Comamonas aquatica]
MRRLRHLTNRHRAPSTNMALGLLLAFNAGAVNAGGFLILGMYTSHMTGFASQLADSLVLGNGKLLLNALGAILAFMTGAAVCAVLVNWGRQRQLYSVYALPLMLEALMLFPFGLMGTVTLNWNTPFAVPLTVLLLSFMMGLQNAVGSKTSGGSTRTTHMTGNFTDLGMELGKALFWRRQRRQAATALPAVQHDWHRMRMTAGLIAMFVLGGITGALGFKHIGFFCVVPLALLLLALSVPPFLRDAAHSTELQALWRRFHQR